MNIYLFKLFNEKNKIIKKLYSAFIMLLVSFLLIISTSFAWLIISTSPEISNISATVGGNGNLEICLSTKEHLETLLSNNMYEVNSDLELTNGDPIHDNVLWGNLIDLSTSEYGLNSLNMRPVIINETNGIVSDIPVSVGKYGEDGRLNLFNFDLENIDLKSVGFTGVYDNEKNIYSIGSYSLENQELESGNIDKDNLVEYVLNNKEYGVRVAGPLEYSFIPPEVNDSMSIDLGVDGYCFAIDVLIRTNAVAGNLMLQTEGIKRYEGEMIEENFGKGSFISLSNRNLNKSIKVLFTDTKTNEIYALAQADSDGNLWITERADDDGTLYPTAADDAAMIKPLVQNQVTAITAWIYLDGEKVSNKDVYINYSDELKMNLQFSTDTELNPANTDVNTQPFYPNRPDMPSDTEEVLNVGAVSNAHFEMIDNQIYLKYDYPTGIDGITDYVNYNINVTNTEKNHTVYCQVNNNNKSLLRLYKLTEGNYDLFTIESEYRYEVVETKEFDNLNLTVNLKDSTNENLFVKIYPTSPNSNYAFTYTITGLTPNTPFLLYTASKGVALGTDEEPWYSAVVLGVSDSYGNITADLEAWDIIQNLKDNPDEPGAELTKMYFKVVEYSDPHVSDDGLNASITLNTRYDWTHYTPGGVGEDKYTNGTYSDNISWEYTNDGTLTLSGNGEMKLSDNGEYPWTGLKGKITKVVIEDGITTVVNSAFEGFAELEVLSLGKDIVKLEDYAFWKCYNLKEIELPNKLKYIGDCAIRDCNSLTSVIIPNSVTEIGVLSFSGCINLKSITLSSNITAIPQGAFGWCHSLESIVLPSGVQSIGLQGFTACTNLSSITIPSSLTSINYAAFDFCENLKDVYYEGTISEWDSISIDKKYNEYLLNSTIHYNHQ